MTKPTPKIGVVEECSNDYSKVTVTFDETPLEWFAKKSLTPVPQAVADVVNNGRPTMDMVILHPIFLDLISNAYFGKSLNDSDAQQVERFYSNMSSIYGEDFADDIMKINARLEKIIDMMSKNQFPD